MNAGQLKIEVIDGTPEDIGDPYRLCAIPWPPSGTRSCCRGPLRLKCVNRPFTHYVIFLCTYGVYLQGFTATATS